MNMKKFGSSVAKSLIVSMVVMTVGTVSAFAADGTTATSTSTSTSTSTTTSTSTSTAASTDATTQASPADQQTSDQPSLLPGNFFYFVKTMVEKIQLAITFNDVSKAKLLAEFSSERIAEATALMAEGKTDLAKETLQKALETQQDAIQKEDSATGDSSGTTSSTSDSTATSASTTVTEDVYEGMSKKDAEKVGGVHKLLQKNIVALAAALTKVKSPQAQQSILKNIEKSFTHLQKKLDKLQNKNSKQDAQNPDDTQSQDAQTQDQVQTQASQDQSVSSDQTKTSSSQETKKSEKSSQDQKKKEANDKSSEKTSSSNGTEQSDAVKAEVTITQGEKAQVTLQNTQAVKHHDQQETEKKDQHGKGGK